MTMNKSLIALAAVGVLALSGCGGGDDIIINPPPASVVVHETIVQPPPLPIVMPPVPTALADVTVSPIHTEVTANSNMEFDVTYNIGCSTTAAGYCEKLVLVHEARASAGTIYAMSVSTANGWQWISGNAYGGTFNPTDRLVFDRPGQFIVHMKASKLAVGVVPLRFDFSVIGGTIAVKGETKLEVRNGVVEVAGVTSADFRGDGFREVAGVTLICPLPDGHQCRLMGETIVQMISTTVSATAVVDIKYEAQSGDSYENGRMVDVQVGEWRGQGFGGVSAVHFAGSIRLSVRTNLPAGLILLIPGYVTDDEGQPLFINTGCYALLGGCKGG
jgi:hypothetical protein